jgi:hypothetical protein
MTLTSDMYDQSSWKQIQGQSWRSYLQVIDPDVRDTSNRRITIEEAKLLPGTVTSTVNHYGQRIVFPPNRSRQTIQRYF